jgi:hypothetical protein
MRWGGLAVCGLTAAVLALSACGGGGNAKLSDQTLKFTERDKGQNAFGFVDNPPKTRLGREGPEKVSNGDEISFAADLLDPSKKDLGDLDASCLFTQATGRFETSSAVCSGVATLSGGSLSLSVGGKSFAGGTTKGAVVGGTGKYAGATGDFSSTESGGNQPSQDTFHIFVPKK